MGSFLKWSGGINYYWVIEKITGNQKDLISFAFSPILLSGLGIMEKLQQLNCSQHAVLFFLNKALHPRIS